MQREVISPDYLSALEQFETAYRNLKYEEDEQKFVPNPSYKHNYSGHTLDGVVGAIGIEIQVLQAGVKFDNIILTTDERDAEILKDTFINRYE